MAVAPSGAPFGSPFGAMAGPMAAPGTPAPVFAPHEGGPLMSGLVVDPLYMQSLAAQVWPVQALLESLRRQYGGS